MSAHWAHGTITKWFTAPILSAAALLVGCEQATGPAPTGLRPGGVIQADAQAGTVSAKGNGQVAQTLECDLVPTLFCPVSGGLGAMFSFDFTGPAPIASTFTDASGTFSVKFRETGDVVQFEGMGQIYPGDHYLTVDGNCSVTPATGMPFSAGCHLDVMDQGEPNSGDSFNFSFTGAARSGLASAPVISGGMHID